MLKVRKLGRRSSDGSFDNDDGPGPLLPRRPRPERLSTSHEDDDDLPVTTPKRAPVAHRCTPATAPDATVDDDHDEKAEETFAAREQRLLGTKDPTR